MRRAFSWGAVRFRIRCHRVAHATDSVRDLPEKTAYQVQRSSAAVREPEPGMKPGAPATPPLLLRLARSTRYTAAISREAVACTAPLANHDTSTMLKISLRSHLHTSRAKRSLICNATPHPSVAPTPCLPPRPLLAVAATITLPLPSTPLQATNRLDLPIGEEVSPVGLLLFIELRAKLVDPRAEVGRVPAEGDLERGQELVHSRQQRLGCGRERLDGRRAGVNDDAVREVSVKWEREVWVSSGFRR